MIKKFKNFVLSGILLLAIASPGAAFSGVALAATATTDSGCGTGGIADQTATGAGTAASGAGTTQTITCDPNGGGNATGAVGDLAKKVVNIFTIIVGAASVFMIIYGGFRYITSGGSSEKVGNAKNTLIYAIVGLIIVALAQIIVHFVLSQAASSGNSFG